ncbi:hypothetical protein MHY1_02231 [Methylovirgula sp. HY1]|nr:hypothetical protein MHY1_02231 [Methylovirgula sp. HY1]
MESPDRKENTQNQNARACPCRRSQPTFPAHAQHMLKRSRHAAPSRYHSIGQHSTKGGHRQGWPDVHKQRKPSRCTQVTLFGERTIRLAFAQKARVWRGYGAPTLISGSLFLVRHRIYPMSKYRKGRSTFPEHALASHDLCAAGAPMRDLRRHGAHTHNARHEPGIVLLFRSHDRHNDRGERSAAIFTRQQRPSACRP